MSVNVDEYLKKASKIGNDTQIDWVAQDAVQHFATMILLNQMGHGVDKALCKERLELGKFVNGDKVHAFEVQCITAAQEAIAKAGPTTEVSGAAGSHLDVKHSPNAPVAELV